MGVLMEVYGCLEAGPNSAAAVPIAGVAKLPRLFFFEYNNSKMYCMLQERSVKRTFVSG